MTVKDTGAAWLRSDLTGLGGLIASLGGPSEADKEAKRAQEEAINQAKSQLDLNKEIYRQNNQTVDDTLADIWGTPRSQPAAVSASTPGAAAPASAPAASGATKADYDQLNALYQTQQGARESGQEVPAQVEQQIQQLLQKINTPAPQQTAGAAPAPSGREETTLGQTFGRLGSARNPFSTQSKDPADHPGPNISTVPGAQAEALRQLKESGALFSRDLDSISPVELELLTKFADSQAKVSDETRAAQKAAIARQSGGLDQLQKFTSVQETPEEKLLREMARRNMESDLKAGRDATAANLKARGVYGSGAELASSLAATQEQAQRRALEEMGANANASKRAVDATGKYTDALGNFSDMNLKMGDQELTQGRYQDIANQAREGLQVQQNVNKAKIQGDEADRSAKRAATKADVRNNLARTIKDDALTNANLRLTGAGLKVGVNTSGAQGVNTAGQNYGQTFKDKAAFDVANDPAYQKVGLF